ncbi:MAG: hypothetical protein ABIG63_09430 [Chloroflexota bacterium]
MDIVLFCQRRRNVGGAVGNNGDIHAFFGLEIGDWRLEIGDWRLESRKP